MASQVNESSSKEATIGLSLPLEDGFTRLASWKSFLGEFSTEAWFHSQVERSAFSLDSGGAWSDRDPLGVANPSSVHESPPHAFVISVDKATMMPVASVEGPSSGSEASL